MLNRMSPNLDNGIFKGKLKVKWSKQMYHERGKKYRANERFRVHIQIHTCIRARKKIIFSRYLFRRPYMYLDLYPESFFVPVFFPLSGYICKATLRETTKAIFMLQEWDSDLLSPLNWKLNGQNKCTLKEGKNTGLKKNSGYKSRHIIRATKTISD